jgi:thymidylate synthase (FAD)
MKSVHAKVKLVSHSPNPAQVIASAAKLCYAEQTDHLFAQEPSSAGKFVKMLKTLGHLSPLEHVSFTFYIEGVSRSMTHQLVRHRLASYSQRSQRYVAHEDFDYIVPPQLKGKKIKDHGKKIDAVEYFEETMKILAGRYRKLSKTLDQKGESTNEDARYVLPNACETKIIMTMNARELLHFLEERLCLRAQWEIRNVANLMLDLVLPVLSSVFEGAGPKCVRLKGCPEGKMTCGKYAEVKTRYASSKGVAS